MTDAIATSAIDAIEANAIDTIDAIEAIDTNAGETIPQINITLSNNADNATLHFFSNPVYLSMINKRLETNKVDNRVNIKFYKKRLVSLFKDMIKGDEMPPNQELKEFYNRFVNTAINYFEMVDKKDIIQSQHNIQGEHIQGEHIQGEHIQGEHIQGEHIQGQPNIEDLPNIEDVNIDKANDLMMKKTIQVASLDNYVITMHDNSSTDFRIIPLKKEIDLKTHDLKTKGVKPRLKKSINKEEDLS
jgi:hypothetical protein